ncbi:MAG: hypothetical protein IJ228_06480 [Succinivibrio sp.]|nr:hypothetical protein [Succinivibrio sp.]
MSVEPNFSPATAPLSAAKVSFATPMHALSELALNNYKLFKSVLAMSEEKEEASVRSDQERDGRGREISTGQPESSISGTGPSAVCSGQHGAAPGITPLQVNELAVPLPELPLDTLLGNLGVNCALAGQPLSEVPLTNQITPPRPALSVLWDSEVLSLEDEDNLPYKTLRLINILKRWVLQPALEQHNQAAYLLLQQNLLPFICQVHWLLVSFALPQRRLRLLKKKEEPTKNRPDRKKENSEATYAAHAALLGA